MKYVLASVAMLLAVTTGAQSHPAAQRQLSRGAIAPPVRAPRAVRARHNIFGMMGDIGPRRFLLRTRTGRIFLVDYAAALSSGTYSAPLFRGKIVMVSGDFDRGRLFHATAITRYNSLDATTPRDN